MTSDTKEKMRIGLTSGNGYGFQPAAWKMLDINPTDYTSYDARVKHTQAAECGEFHFT